MERCKTYIKEFSQDINMHFGLNKCAVIHIKRGEVENSPIADEIPILKPEESYKYLGIAQNDTILHDKVKENTKKEFIRRVKEILKKQISAKRTTMAIKTFALPVIRYGIGIIRWTKNELRTIDSKLRKTLHKHRFHHPRSDTDRLYMSRKQEERSRRSGRLQQTRIYKHCELHKQKEG